MKFRIFFALTIAFAGTFCISFKAVSTNKYKTISAFACDSLIKANDKNPDFVILDVRTPSVWASDHLTGSINRNYYDTDFTTQINALPKHKIYLLHCQSGGRSAPTLSTMKNQNFAEVYEMAGGINSWKSASLKTISGFAPRFMLVSNDIKKKGTVRYGNLDTLKIIVTNRANDTLKFTSISLPEGNEFSTNFDLKKKLTGGEDYSFSLYYKPMQIAKDSVKIGIKSNGGDLSLKVVLNMGTVLQTQALVNNFPALYPNPGNQFVTIRNVDGLELQDVFLIDMKGEILKRISGSSLDERIDVSDLPAGLYFVRLMSKKNSNTQKLIISR
jgi:rhodanese-related sulfurtransferase